MVDFSFSFSRLDIQFMKFDTLDSDCSTPLSNSSLLIKSDTPDGGLPLSTQAKTAYFSVFSISPFITPFLLF